MRTVAMYTADRSDPPTVTKCRHFAYYHFNNFGAMKREVSAARRHPTSSLPGSTSKGQRSGTRIRDGHSRRATLVATGRSCANARKDLVAGAATVARNVATWYSTADRVERRVVTGLDEALQRV
jgi:hypothetical protein